MPSEADVASVIRSDRTAPPPLFLITARRCRPLSARLSDPLSARLSDGRPDYVTHLNTVVIAASAVLPALPLLPLCAGVAPRPPRRPSSVADPRPDVTCRPQRLYRPHLAGFCTGPSVPRRLPPDPERARRPTRTRILSVQFARPLITAGCVRPLITGAEQTPGPPAPRLGCLLRPALTRLFLCSSAVVGSPLCPAPVSTLHPASCPRCSPRVVADTALDVQ